MGLRGRAARKNILPCSSLPKRVRSYSRRTLPKSGYGHQTVIQDWFRIWCSYSHELHGAPVLIMPFVTVHGKRLHYADTKADADAGAGAGAHTIVFVHGLGSTQNYFF